ncbi:unnamed protein product [Owenia fusiformis]|uniref:Glycosyltransferase 2-like domain-containing protein n=1 Tax=Owenia fusiformis TaxID=6347 RepID=A0A8J1UQY7_OWEFU|nr:unnamed protein product [Owenia fusiformis]
MFTMIFQLLKNYYSYRYMLIFVTVGSILLLMNRKNINTTESITRLKKQEFMDTELTSTSKTMKIKELRCEPWENEDYNRVIGYGLDNYVKLTEFPTEHCSDNSLCGARLDNSIEPIRFRDDLPVDACLDPEICVTVICKTATRLNFAQKLVASIWRLYPRIFIIIVGDRNNKYTNDHIWYKTVLSNRHRLLYIQENSTVGISAGRNRALQLVKTKYFFLTDDDIIPATKSSYNLTDMLYLMQISDFDIIGGSYSPHIFTGIWHAANSNQTMNSIDGAVSSNAKKGFVNLFHYTKYHYAKLSCFESCYHTDATLNIFLAKTADIINISGWDCKFKMDQEHLDFFLRAKIARLKVGICYDFLFDHISSSTNVVHLRRLQLKPYFEHLFLEKWNITYVYSFGRLQRKKRVVLSRFSDNKYV